MPVYLVTADLNCKVPQNFDPPSRLSNAVSRASTGSVQSHLSFGAGASKPVSRPPSPQRAADASPPDPPAKRQKTDAVANSAAKSVAPPASSRRYRTRAQVRAEAEYEAREEAARLELEQVEAEERANRYRTRAKVRAEAEYQEREEAARILELKSS